MSGLTIAFVSYRQFFPSLMHPNSQLPLQPRVDLSVNHTRGRLRLGQEEMEPMVLSDDDEDHN
jgi:hypothetical protein